LWWRRILEVRIAQKIDVDEPSFNSSAPQKVEKGKAIGGLIVSLGPIYRTRDPKPALGFVKGLLDLSDAPRIRGLALAYEF
jgi:hypothetical protein